MNRTILALACASALGVASCGGGGSTSGKPQMSMMPHPETETEMEQEETPTTPTEPTEPTTTTSLRFVPGTFQTSHELQASSIQTNWTQFNDDPGSAIAYGDFDGDGDEDFFIAGVTIVQPPPGAPEGYYSEPTPVQVWENDGNGNFSENTGKFFDGNIPSSLNARKVITGDYNNDGRLDILLATTGIDAPPFIGEELILFLSSASGLQKQDELTRYIGFHHGAASGDIDNDGDLDIFVTDTTNEPFFLINDGSGTFDHNTSNVPSEINESLAVHTTELVDVDGDGNDDLLVGGHEHAAPTTIYWGNGTGKYLESSKTIISEITGFGIVIDIDVGDLDGDGNNDIVLNRTGSDNFYDGHYIQVIAGRGNRTFTDQTSQRIDVGMKRSTAWLLWLRLVDINRDGHLDIVVDGNNPGNHGLTWLNNGEGRLQFARERHTPFIHDWMRQPMGLNDTQIRQQVNSVIDESHSVVNMNKDGLVSKVGDFSLPTNVQYEQIAGFPHIGMALGYQENDDTSYLSYGGWLEHSMFHMSVVMDENFDIQVDSHSLGNATGSNPVSGSATWQGAVVGVDTHTIGRGQVFRGRSEISVDFANSDVDVKFSGMRFLAEGNYWRRGITWNDLPMNDGGFGNDCSATDCISGMFYGGNHEEVGGVFRYEYLTGAFGGTRE